jgi:hypothetical protein
VHVSVGLGIIALLAVLVALWGGLAPFVGPSFGYDANGSAALYWDVDRAVLNVVPAALGLIGGLTLLGLASSWRQRLGHWGMGFGGGAMLLAGLWLIVGPFCWSAARGRPYFVGGSSWRHAESVLGLDVGPGIVLAVLGAGVLGYLACARALGAPTGTTRW